MKTPRFFHTSRLIQQRESLSHFWSKGIFITIAISILISSFFLNNRVRYTQTNIVSVENQPLLIPIVIGVFVIALYLALMLILSIARERERGTLEILLIGPVNETAYVWGIFLAYLKIFILSITVFFLWSLVSTLILNMPFKWELSGIFLASILMAGELNAAGIFLVSLVKRPRHSLILFILIVLFLGAVHLADELVTQMAIASSSVAIDPLVVIRNLLMHANQVLSTFSPFSHLLQAVQELLNGNGVKYVEKLSVMLFEALGLIVLGSIVLRRKRGRE